MNLSPSRGGRSWATRRAVVVRGTSEPGDLVLLRLERLLPPAAGRGTVGEEGRVGAEAVDGGRARDRRRRPRPGATGRGRGPGRRTRSRNTRSWLATTTTPGIPRSVSSTNRTASSSRWFVGSSRSTQSGRRTSSAASPSRDRSPPDIAPTGLSRGIAASPSRAAASSARRVASQASWWTAQSSSAAYSSATAGSSSRPASASRCATAWCSGASAAIEDVADQGLPRYVEVLPEVAEVSGSPDGAGVGLLEPGKETEQGRLAGAVLAHEREHAAGGGGDVEAVEDDTFAVGLGQVARHQRGRRGRGRRGGGGRGHGDPSGRAGDRRRARGLDRAGDGSDLHDARSVPVRAGRCCNRFPGPRRTLGGAMTDPRPTPQGASPTSTTRPPRRWFPRPSRR